MNTLTSPAVAVDPATTIEHDAGGVVVNRYSVAAPPTAISEATCEKELGLPRRAFRKLVKAAGIPAVSTSVGLVVLRDDVVHAMQKLGSTVAPTTAKIPEPRKDDDVMALLGVRRGAR